MTYLLHLIQLGIKKIKALRIIMSLTYYRSMFEKECASCGRNPRVYSPIGIKGLCYFTIGDDFKIDYHSIIEAWDKHGNQSFTPRVRVGNNVSLGKNCHIGSINSIIIEDNVLMGSNVMIIDHNHGSIDYSDLSIPPRLRPLSSNGPIHICKNVWIGEKVSILSGVTIGENSIIGANSVVTKDIPSNVVACGIPAKVIKKI